MTVPATTNSRLDTVSHGLARTKRINAQCRRAVRTGVPPSADMAATAVATIPMHHARNAAYSGCRWIQVLA
ncbi:hypothetical protein GCM10007863_06770 [Dyella mobilis]|nr:hypothetical protein GCM10007863_06770 [Dyella mobilis]